jgi:hypothetical protein
VNSALELLALRKEVLVARAALQRLQVRREIEVIREDLRWPRALVAIAASRPARSALLGALVVLAGRGRLARLVGAAAAVTAIVKASGLFAPRAPAQDGAGGAGVPPNPRPGIAD